MKNFSFFSFMIATIIILSCARQENDSESQSADNLISQDNLSKAFVDFVQTNPSLVSKSAVSEEINSRMIPCGPESVSYLDCNIPPQDFTFTVNHPGGCDVDVVVRVKACIDMSSSPPTVYMTFTMVDFTFLNLNPGSPCFNWVISIINLPPDQANEEIDLFLDYIKADAERQFMTAWVLANSGQFPCIGAVIDLQAAFFSAACTQRCLVFDPSEPFGLVFTDEACDEEGCCMKITEWCENANGSVGNGGGSALELIRPCNNENTSNISCKKGILWGESCREKVPNCSK